MFNHNYSKSPNMHGACCLAVWHFNRAIFEHVVSTTCAAVPPGVRVIPWWIVFEFHNSKTDLVWAPIFTPCPGVPVVSWCARWVESCVGLFPSDELGIHLVHGSWIYMDIWGRVPWANLHRGMSSSRPCHVLIFLSVMFSSSPSHVPVMLWLFVGHFRIMF